MPFLLKRILLIILALLIFPFAIALALIFLLFDFILSLTGPSGRRGRNAEGRILVIQSAEPEYVLDALKRLRGMPRFRDSVFTVFCRNRSEVLRHFIGHPMFSQVLTHSETQGWWEHLTEFRRERFDTVVVFFTGDPSYWKIKCFAFLLGGRQKMIFDENGNSAVLSLSTLFTLSERDLVISGLFRSNQWKMHLPLRRIANWYCTVRSRMHPAVSPRNAAESAVVRINPPFGNQTELPDLPEGATHPADRQPGLANARQMTASLAKLALDSFLSSQTRLRLPDSPEPKVSAILVLYNRAELTFQCLRSLRENEQESMEIIIWDNASSDATASLLDRLDGPKILRSRENLNFLKGANLAAQQARGRYILFLNNDAQVLPGTISAAIGAIECSSDIGAVGGKLILPDGLLQEAGSIIWRDGSCLGYGRGEDPLHPRFMFRRDVDYCSGAFLLTPRDIFMNLGGFDEAYQPFYYEETDYCLRLWKRGLRVVYEPDATVFHYEFASSSPLEAPEEWHAKHQVRLIERHRDRLQRHYEWDEKNILKARTAGTPRHTVLLVDDRIPHPALGSGFPRANSILSNLAKSECVVTLYPTAVINEEWQNVYADIPREVEVMLDYGPERLNQFLANRAGYYDLIFVSRPHNMQLVRPILQTHPEWFQSTKIIYDAEALFTLRDVIFQKIKGEPLSDEEVEQLIQSEVELASSADLVLSVSDSESEMFSKFGIRKVHVLGHAITPRPTLRAFGDRSGILFVGSILEENSPNGDAVLWFLREILPIIRNKLGNVPFTVAGMNRLDFSTSPVDNQLRVLGKVDDLSALYDHARIFVAPTRFAAGIPHKIHEAAARGIPVIATSLLAYQLGWRDGMHLLTADEPRRFAEQSIRLYTDAALWRHIRRNALNRVRSECSPRIFEDTLKRIIEGESNADTP